MRTILSGPVTANDVDMAGLLADITPTLFITNGRPAAPIDGVPVEVHPVCEKLGGQMAIDARDYTLCQRAEALILAGENDHLLRVARQYGLRIHQA